VPAVRRSQVEARSQQVAIEDLIAVAAGDRDADLVLKNGMVVNVFSGEIYRSDVGIQGNRIAGVGSYSGKNVIDVEGKYVCPGLIDGHVHIESSMVSIPEFARVVVPQGTTTVVVDPHEIANVMERKEFCSRSRRVSIIHSTSLSCFLHVFLQPTWRRLVPS